MKLMAPHFCVSLSLVTILLSVVLVNNVAFLSRWYHGRINRRVAASRLEEVGRPGAYLVRDSESEPGSFVLSFLDHDGLVFHYRINCQDGQYNTAGQSNRWFSSLQTLLGYYMKYSTVRKNQHLGVAVSPPEVGVT